LVVYVDTSASMAGYVASSRNVATLSDDGMTIFSRTLKEVRNAVTVMNNQPKIFVRRVDVEVGSPLDSDVELSKYAENRATFNGKETNLAGAIEAFGQPLRTPSESGEVDSAAKFHILITDGVQSSKSGSSGPNCTSGSDSICVKQKIRALLDKGWGASVIGLKSEFEGNIYSEITGGAIPYLTGRDKSRFRPFFLYVMSPDREALEGLLTDLRRRFSEFDGADLREFPLTSAYSTGEPVFTGTSLNNEKGALSIYENQMGIGRIVMEISMDTEYTNEPTDFEVKVKVPLTVAGRLGGNLDELASRMTWTLTPYEAPDIDSTGSRFADIQLFYKRSATSSEGKGRGASDSIDLLFKGIWKPGTGSADWRMYQLIGDFDRTLPGLKWIDDWSTDSDTKPENGHKILNLQTSLGGLWGHESVRSTPIARACVAAGSF